MHGPGLPPQQGPYGRRPLSGAAMTLRVLFTALPVLSCGFLAWGSLLRLALLTRKGRDWALLVLSGPLAVLWIVFIEMDPSAETNGWQGNVGAGGSLFTGFAICVYYLVSDIRHHEAAARSLAPAAQPAPWYPAPQTPYGQHQPPHQQHQPPHQQQHPSLQQTSPSYGYPPVQQPPAAPAAQPAAPVPPQPTPPPRLGQVRAELDELSELLRKQTPARPPQPGGPYQDPNSTAVQGPEQ
ncbi:hypothetical protein OOK31_34340 [Streptomyces sp. NBC_00249]|uniref:hypothetical protein n=1 Tax=Streptomyces sp. NBC_00249 TaxID=2975690 RepID=UPI00224E9AF0|nr:hypothetical protein [Streptomyces sp. NBC_00249]MCX5198908.1 hypothetical protein [Streptomyces sp. NBC_00249]